MHTESCTKSHQDRDANSPKDLAASSGAKKARQRPWWKSRSLPALMPGIMQKKLGPGLAGQ